MVYAWYMHGICMVYAWYAGMAMSFCPPVQLLSNLAGRQRVLHLLVVDLKGGHSLT